MLCFTSFRQNSFSNYSKIYNNPLRNNSDLNHSSSNTSKNSFWIFKFHLSVCFSYKAVSKEILLLLYWNGNKNAISIFLTFHLLVHFPALFPNMSYYGFIWNAFLFLRFIILYSFCTIFLRKGMEQKKCFWLKRWWWSNIILKSSFYFLIQVAITFR